MTFFISYKDPVCARYNKVCREIRTPNVGKASKQLSYLTLLDQGNINMTLQERLKTAEANLAVITRSFGNDFKLKKIVNCLYAESSDGIISTVFRMQKANKRHYKSLGKISIRFTLRDAVAQSIQYEEQLNNNGFIDQYLHELQEHRKAIYTLDDLAYDWFVASEAEFGITESVPLKDINRIQSLYHKHIQPVLGDTPVHCIDGSLVELMIKRIRAKSTDHRNTYKATANKALQILEKLLNRAQRYFLVDINVAEHFTARETGYVDTFSRKSFSREQLELLICRLEEAKENEPVNVLCIYLLLLLGPRKGDLIQAENQDFSYAITEVECVDENDIVWNITTKKNGIERAQYITPFVQSLLKELLALQGESSYLFPTRNKNTASPFISPSTPNKFLKRIVPELDKVIHELRHTCRTLLSLFDVSEDAADSYIMHSKKRYRHNPYHKFAERKSAAIKISDSIENLIDKVHEGKISA